METHLIVSLFKSVLLKVPRSIVIALVLAVCYLGALAGPAAVSNPLQHKPEHKSQVSAKQSKNLWTRQSSVCTAHDVLEYFDHQKQNCYTDSLILYPDILQPLVSPFEIPNINPIDAVLDFCENCEEDYIEFLEDMCGDDTEADRIRDLCADDAGDADTAGILILYVIIGLTTAVIITVAVVAGGCLCYCFCRN